MIVLYSLVILVIALLVWLGMRRKWKLLLWTMVSVTLVAVAGWYIFLHTVSEAFEAECEEHRVWKIENYVIIERKCIGFAGPHYYPVYLYEDNKEIDRLASINDSACVVKFKPDRGDTLTFDICEMKLERKQ